MVDAGIVHDENNEETRKRATEEQLRKRVMIRNYRKRTTHHLVFWKLEILVSVH